MRYAIIENSAVANVIWLYEVNASDFPNAVRLGDRPVTIGDSYIDGRFYRDGAEVLTPLEQAQAEISAAENDMAALVEMIYESDMEVIG